MLVMTLTLFCGYFIAGAKLPSLTYATATSRLAGSNLKCVMTTWLIQHHDHPQKTHFDTDVARQETSVGFSPYTESQSAKLNALTIYLMRNAPLFVIPTMAYLVAVSLLFGKRTQRIAVGLLVPSLFILYGSLLPSNTARLFFPGSHAFLDDIAFLPSIDLSKANTRRGRTIAAYDKRSFQGSGKRGLAFADGHVEWLFDEKARPLFADQGIAYPNPDDTDLP